MPSKKAEPAAAPAAVAVQSVLTRHRASQALRRRDEDDMKYCQIRHNRWNGWQAPGAFFANKTHTTYRPKRAPYGHTDEYTDWHIRIDTAKAGGPRSIG